MRPGRNAGQDKLELEMAKGVTKVTKQTIQNRIGRLAVTLAAIGMAAGLSTAALAQASLNIESWRNDDIEIWNKTIIPAFNKVHPDIKVKFVPIPPADYNASLNAKLAGGTAGDLISLPPV